MQLQSDDLNVNLTGTDQPYRIYSLAILHNVNGTLVDVTATTPVRN